MKLPREPLNRRDLLLLCGKGTNDARQRAIGMGYISRGAVRELVHSARSDDEVST